MKLRHCHQNRRRGSATLVVLGLVSIMGIYVSIQFTAAIRLQSNLRVIEKRQLQRLKTETRTPSSADASHDQRTNR